MSKRRVKLRTIEGNVPGGVGDGLFPPMPACADHQPEYEDDGRFKPRRLAQIICNFMAEKGYLKDVKNFVQIIDDLTKEIKHMRSSGDKL
jgi:hypothetical protein